MAEQTKGKLTVRLYDNGLTSDPKDRIGKILLRNSLKIEDLARDVVPLVGDIQYETILGVMRRMVDAAISRVADGFAVDFGVCHIYPTVIGAFPSPNSKFNPEVNSVAARYAQTIAMRRGLEKAMIEVVGDAVVGPVITEVEDMKTREIDTTVTPMKNLCLRGSRIRIAGEDPANGVRFIPVNDGQIVKVAVDDIVINDPSTVMIIVPKMDEGEYYVELTTQFSSKGVNVKEPRSYRYEQVLSVIAQPAP